ncbi:hypothetical protein B0H10DRAFT_2197017 [Mycena sp. CBHHK59/15]|nr:hypothetical protein B0H10DRAFT_2197017 [Mycena sp. CBHHK59/15]
MYFLKFYSDRMIGGSIAALIPRLRNTGLKPQGVVTFTKSGLKLVTKFRPPPYLPRGAATDPPSPFQLSQATTTATSQRSGTHQLRFQLKKPELQADDAPMAVEHPREPATGASAENDYSSSRKSGQVSKTQPEDAVEEWFCDEDCRVNTGRGRKRGGRAEPGLNSLFRPRVANFKAEYLLGQQPSDTYAPVMPNLHYRHSTPPQVMRLRQTPNGNFGGDELKQTYGVPWSIFAESVITRPHIHNTHIHDSVPITVNDDGTVIFPSLDLETNPIPLPNLRQLLREYFEKCWNFARSAVLYPHVAFLLVFFLCSCSSINPFRPRLSPLFAVKHLTRVQLFLDRTQRITVAAAHGAA